MDPKHVIKALAVLYLEERGNYVRISREVLLDAQGKSMPVVEPTADENVVIVRDRAPGRCHNCGKRPATHVCCQHPNWQLCAMCVHFHIVAGHQVRQLA